MIAEIERAKDWTDLREAVLALSPEVRAEYERLTSARERGEPDWALEDWREVVDRRFASWEIPIPLREQALDDQATAVIRGAYLIIEDRARWCRVDLVRREENNPTRFCALGALRFVADDLDVVPGVYSRACQRICDVTGWGSISLSNDGPFGHYRVCRAFRKALST